MKKMGVKEIKAVIWQVCIRYSNGSERVLRSYRDREIALRYIDALYADGYPLHLAYIARPFRVQAA
ncbi:MULTISPECIES: hypothetical protein [unclassified Phormidesmis]